MHASSRRATDPCRSPTQALGPRREIGLQRARSAARRPPDPRRDLGAVERLRPGESQRAGRRFGIGRAPRPRPRRCRADRSTRSGPSPVGNTKRPAREQRELALRAPTRRTTAAARWTRRGDAASRRSIARWLPCRPSSSPAIGMFETFTTCSTPAALRRLDRVGLERDLIARRRADEEDALARRRTRRRATSGSPRSASTTLADAVDVGVRGAGHRPHVGAARHQRARDLARRDHRSHRSRARSRRCSLSRSTRAAVREPRPGPGIGRELTVPPGARVRAAHPRARGLAREPVGPHHVGHARRRHVVQPVGHLVGRGARVRHPAPRRRRQRSSRATGTSRPPCSSTPSCTAPAPTPRSSCTTIRTTRRCSRRWASCRAWCTRTRASSTTSSRSSTSTPASTTPSDGKWLADAGRRRERDPARAPRRDRDRADDRRGVLQGRRRSSACAASPTTSSRPGARRSRCPPEQRARAARPLLHQNTPQRVLGRRGAHAARATSRRCST